MVAVLAVGLALAGALWPTADEPETSSFIVQGADAEAAAALEAAIALGLEPGHQPPLDQLLSAAGLDPEGYRPGFRAELSPDQTALAAVVAICRTLQRSWRCNEAGLKDDVDTEFLHDFRVALRRTRSALTLFRGSFAARPTARFKQEFAALVDPDHTIGSRVTPGGAAPTEIDDMTRENDERASRWAERFRTHPSHGYDTRLIERAEPLSRAPGASPT